MQPMVPVVGRVLPSIQNTHHQCHWAADAAVVVLRLKGSLVFLLYAGALTSLPSVMILF